MAAPPAPPFAEASGEPSMSAAPSALSAEVFGTNRRPPIATITSAVAHATGTRRARTYAPKLNPRDLACARNIPNAPFRNGVSMKRYESSAATSTMPHSMRYTHHGRAVTSPTGFMRANSGKCHR